MTLEVLLEAQQVLALNLGLLSCENSFIQVGLEGTLSVLSEKTPVFKADVIVNEQALAAGVALE